MIFYYVPGTGIYGGVKVAFQFVEMLNSLGVRAVVVTPDGSAPRWFRVRTAVLPEKEAAVMIAAGDRIMITWPPDYRRLRGLPAPMLCHCQGTDPLLDEVFADRQVPVLTCWTQAEEHLREKFGRSSIAVGISISDCFFRAHGVKQDNLVAYMPRRGCDTAQACIDANRGLYYQPIEGMNEEEVSRCMGEAGVYLATSLGEWFGLPALEAMAAGCLVLSVPVRGGMEYLRDGENCLVGDPEELPRRLKWIMRPENTIRRNRMRAAAAATAGRYRKIIQRKRMASLVDGDPGRIFG